MGQDVEAVRLEDLQSRLLGPRARADEVVVFERWPATARSTSIISPARS